MCRQTRPVKQAARAVSSTESLDAVLDSCAIAGLAPNSQSSCCDGGAQTPTQIQGPRDGAARQDGAYNGTLLGQELSEQLKSIQSQLSSTKARHRQHQSSRRLRLATRLTSSSWTA